MRNLLFVLAMLLAVSCASTVKFPLSSVAPAADITAVKKTDKHNNFTINVTAKNLASVDRIAPSKKTYVVWVSTKNEGIKNIGQLNVRNAKTSSLKTLTAFDFDEVIITAEEQGDIMYPSGTEISRTRIK
ncbi:MAG: hypothetical protein RBR81_02910 [Bacteroidales bacterium]|jgi:hypothetical protein|nr:hypothetical protein [Bacteroidales bacterium]